MTGDGASANGEANAELAYEFQAEPEIGKVYDVQINSDPIDDTANADGMSSAGFELMPVIDYRDVSAKDIFDWARRKWRADDSLRELEVAVNECPGFINSLLDEVSKGQCFEMGLALLELLHDPDRFVNSATSRISQMVN